MHIRLLVLRTGNLKRLAYFYGLFGVNFDYHKHVDAPFHYAAAMDQTILEIYPLTKKQTEPDISLRLGFEIDNFEETVQRLKREKVPFVSDPAITDSGYMAVITDPDGRKIKIYRTIL